MVGLVRPVDRDCRRTLRTQPHRFADDVRYTHHALRRIHLADSRGSADAQNGRQTRNKTHEI